MIRQETVFEYFLSSDYAIWRSSHQSSFNIGYVDTVDGVDVGGVRHVDAVGFDASFESNRCEYFLRTEVMIILNSSRGRQKKKERSAKANAKDTLTRT